MQVSIPHWYVHNACNECRVSSVMFECRINMNQLVPIPPLHQVVEEDHTQVSELKFCVCTLHAVVDLCVTEFLTMLY